MIKIHNSLSKKLEEFVPINKGIVTMYSCGPTVYSFPHIGNMRAYIFMDSLRRMFKYNGYKINGVMNITDVGHLTSDQDNGEDKMELTAKKEQKSPYEIAEFYTKAFLTDLSNLNIDMPEHITKATEYVSKMIKFVQKLESMGYTYKLSDGIYFDITKFKAYGQLSNKDLESIKVSRVEENPDKHHPYDFALWKFVPTSHIMKWDSPWGVGCPGWHIECSTMSTDILGDKIDIHTGGIDHLTIHHENEIAQNDCACGHQVVNAWMHNEFVLVDGGKMSKSLGNVYTINQLIEMGYSPMDFKYFCLNTSYSKKINFTFDALNSAQNGLKKLKSMLNEHKGSSEKTESEVLLNYKQLFLEAINADLNIPLALGILWTAIKEPKSKDIYDLIIEFDKALGLKLYQEDGCQQNDIPEEVLVLAKKRNEARVNKDWASSDNYREQILKLGYVIKDSKEGYTIAKV